MTDATRRLLISFILWDIGLTVLPYFAFRLAGLDETRSLCAARPWPARGSPT
ncbi:hypothetical protein ACIA8C_24020 [Nocardia sp. NPDC051321]|uniref:hypothetical protein n=1 Tax=Nocardia sp. NPDC051321 TaxID=3364323 RepID=UPI0037BC61DB